MLSPESAAVVRATPPAVGGALDEITTRFYGTMFGEQPELLDVMFNRGNQANGEQRQALVGSIAAFAQARSPSRRCGDRRTETRHHVFGRTARGTPRGTARPPGA